MNYKFSVAVLMALVLLLPVLVIVPEEARAETGTTVGTSTSSSPLRQPFNYKGPFYIDDSQRYWMFWYDGTSLVYSSSLDLTTWAAKATVISGSNQFAGVTTDGTYVHVAYGSGTYYYLHGTPATDGTISWGTAQTVLASGGESANPYLTICVTSDNHVAIGYADAASDKSYVTKNGNLASNPVWSVASGFPVNPGATSNYYMPVVRAGDSGSIYALYGGTSLYFRIINSDGSMGTAVGATLSNAANYQAKNMIVVDGVAYIIYLDSSNNIKTRSRSQAGTWDVAEVTHATVSGARMALQYDVSTGELYAMWTTASNTINYRKCSEGTWGDVSTLVDESVDGGLSQTEFNAPPVTQNLNVLVAYKTKTVSPYNIKVASLSLVSPPVAAFTSNVTEAYIDQEIQFTDQSTNTPTEWHWEMGDGGEKSSQNPTHTYSQAGTYTVMLNASNSAGYDVEQKAAYITIYDVPTAAAGVECIDWSRHYHFTDVSEGHGINNWTWVFSDGTISYAQNVEHTFEDYDNWANLTVSNPSGSSYNNASFYVILHFMSEPDESIAVGDYYNYFPETNYGDDANITWSYNTLELENYANGTGFAGRPGVGDVLVSIVAEYQGIRYAYQNYTLSVVAEGSLTDVVAMDIIMYVVALVISFIIAYVGMRSERPIVSLVAALFAVVVLAGLLADADAQAYWWLGMVPIVEFLMFGSSMRS